MVKKMDEYVTVCIFCYNAALTIIELLDSVYMQTYPNLNLVINDDASTDNTVDIVRKWVYAHRERFYKVRFHINKRNRGINYSFDRALRLCETEWVKPIAGDDVLFDDCITLNLNYVKKHCINSVLFSRYVLFSDDKSKYKIKNPARDQKMKRLCKLDAHGQYEKFLRTGGYYAPTTFLNKNMYCDMGGISTQIRNIEDDPLCLQLTKSGYRMHFMEAITVYYREGNNSISTTRGSIYNISHVKQIILMNKLLICPNVPFYDIVFWWRKGIELLRFFLVIKVFGNKNTKVLSLFNKCMLALDPNFWEMIIYSLYNKIKDK